MAYDEELEVRVRQRIGDEPALTEHRMFGGLGFLIGGNLAVGASSEGILVRVGSAESEELTATTSARVMEMRGRPMSGWLRIAAEDVRSDEQLHAWVDRGTAHARSLPPKGSSARPRRRRASR